MNNSISVFGFGSIVSYLLPRLSEIFSSIQVFTRSSVNLSKNIFYYSGSLPWESSYLFDIYKSSCILYITSPDIDEKLEDSRLSLLLHYLQEHSWSGCFYFISSDRVFSSNILPRHQEFDTSPPSFELDPYGFTLSLYERLINDSLSSFKIIRLTKVLHSNSSPLSAWKSNIIQKSQALVFPNYYVSPISLSFVCSVLIALIDPSGAYCRKNIYHLTGFSRISCLDLYILYSRMISPLHTDNNFVTSSEGYIAQRHSHLDLPDFIDHTSVYNMLRSL